MKIPAVSIKPANDHSCNNSFPSHECGHITTARINGKVLAKLQMMETTHILAKGF